MDSAVSGSPYIFWLIGILVLGGILAFTIARRKSRRKQSITDRATVELYDAESREAERER